MYSYIEERIASLRKVEQTREERLIKPVAKMTEAERRAVLDEYPDYAKNACKILKAGVNSGDKVVKEFADLLHGKPLISGKTFDSGL